MRHAVERSGEQLWKTEKLSNVTLFQMHAQDGRTSSMDIGRQHRKDQNNFIWRSIHVLYAPLLFLLLVLLLQHCWPCVTVRETMGISAESTIRAFKETSVAKMESREKIAPGVHTDYLFVSVDPSGGGNSAFAICSLCLSGSGGMKVFSRSVLTLCAPRLLSFFTLTNATIQFWRHLFSTGLLGRLQDSATCSHHQQTSTQ